MREKNKYFRVLLFGVNEKIVKQTVRLSERFYNKIVETLGEEQTFNGLVIELLRKWYNKEILGEADRTLNIEAMVERAVVERILPTLSEMTAILKDVQDRLGGEVSFENAMREYGDKEEQQYPAVEKEDMDFNSVDELMEDIMSVSSSSSQEEVSEEVEEEFNDFISRKYDTGESFGDIKGKKVETAPEPKVVKDVPPPPFHNYPPPPYGGYEEKNKEEEEDLTPKEFSSSRITLKDGIPEVEGLKIVKRVGMMVIYEDGSIWDGHQWFKRGKKLIKILKEDDLA